MLKIFPTLAVRCGAITNFGMEFQQRVMPS